MATVTSRVPFGNISNKENEAPTGPMKQKPVRQPLAPLLVPEPVVPESVGSCIASNIIAAMGVSACNY